MSNLIKSGFVAFSQDKTMVIDANNNKIIKGIEEAIQEAAATQEDASMEDVLAEAMIEDAQLDDFDEEPSVNLLIAKADNASNRQQAAQESAQQIINQAKMDAQQIVNQAHDEAEQMRASAYDDAEQVKNAARSDGYEAGYQEGLEAVAGEYQAKEQALEETLHDHQIMIEKEKEEFVAMMEQQMVEWLCQMVPKVTGVMVDGQRDTLLYMVNEAVKNLDDCKHFVIRVSEADYSWLFDCKERIYGARNPNIDMELFADAKLAEKQCLIETENGVVNLSLDVQLDNLNRALRLMIKE